MALLPERRVGLMHGKLKPKEKAEVMEDFKAGGWMRWSPPPSSRSAWMSPTPPSW